MWKDADKALPNLHTITVIVCIGSVFAEPDNSLYICFSVAAFSYGNCEGTNHKIGCVVVLAKCMFDLGVQKYLGFSSYGFGG